MKTGTMLLVAASALAIGGVGMVPDAAHRDFERLASEEYERRVLGFLERALGAAPLD